MTPPLPHHRASERAAGDRGRAFGVAHAGAVAVTVATYRRLFREAAGAGDEAVRGAGARAGALLDRLRPDLREEIEGIAAGARQDPLALFAVNARTEILAGAAQSGECSVAGLLGHDRVRLAQTWDWHPDLAPARVVVTHPAGDGPGFTTVTEAGIVAKLGLNDAGLAVGLNFLTCSADGGPEGTPIHVLLRMLLDRCATALDALTLLLTTPVSASSCVTVAASSDAGGPALFSVELSPGGAGVCWPDADGRLAHTNHFLAAPRAGRDTQPETFPSTLLRLDRLQRRLAGGADPAAALRDHFPMPEAICRHADPAAAWPDRRATLLCTDLDPVGRTIRVAAGPPCCTPFEAVTP
jgi:isopenicillin-N N-acyltransferase-like protein